MPHADRNYNGFDYMRLSTQWKPIYCDLGGHDVSEEKQLPVFKVYALRDCCGNNACTPCMVGYKPGDTFEAPSCR